MTRWHLAFALPLLTVGAFVAGADDAPPPTPVPASKVLVNLPQDPVPIADWEEAGGWKEDRHSAKRWTVSGGILHMVSAGDSVMIHTERGFPIDLAESPRVHFEVKVDVLPEGSDNSVNGKDDAAFRLYFTFDTSGRPPNTVGYAWTWSDEKDAIVTSGHFSKVKVIVVESGPANVGKWLAFDRDLAADYRRCFGTEKVPKITGVALKCDSNDLKKARADASVRAVELRAQH